MLKVSPRSFAILFIGVPLFERWVPKLCRRGWKERFLTPDFLPRVAKARLESNLLLFVSSVGQKGLSGAIK